MKSVKKNEFGKDPGSYELSKARLSRPRSGWRSFSKSKFHCKGASFRQALVKSADLEAWLSKLSEY